MKKCGSTNQANLMLPQIQCLQTSEMAKHQITTEQHPSPLTVTYITRIKVLAEHFPLNDTCNREIDIFLLRTQIQNDSENQQSRTCKIPHNDHMKHDITEGTLTEGRLSWFPVTSEC